MREKIIEVLKKHAITKTDVGNVIFADEIEAIADELLEEKCYPSDKENKEPICSKCGRRIYCDTCEPFNQPIPPEGLKL